MKFDVFYYGTEEAVELDEFVDFAEEHGLNGIDLEGFMLTYDGMLAVYDNSGRYAILEPEGKYTIKFIGYGNYYY